jgi:hypothetical protein
MKIKRTREMSRDQQIIKLFIILHKLFIFKFHKKTLKVCLNTTNNKKKLAFVVKYCFKIAFFVLFAPLFVIYCVVYRQAWKYWRKAGICKCVRGFTLIKYKSHSITTTLEQKKDQDMKCFCLRIEEGEITETRI